MTDTGTDLYCVTGFVASMPSVDGTTAIAQLAARGLQTPEGRCPWWPNWGRDLRQYLLSKYSPEQIALVARRQILTDERIRTCSVTAEKTSRDITLTVALVAEEEGPFTFTLSITEAAVSLIQLQEEL